MTMWITKLDDGISVSFIHGKMFDFSSTAASCVLKVELQAVLGNGANVKYLDAHRHRDTAN